MMTYRGHVENGVVVLDGKADLAEGDEVSVHLVHRAVADAEAEEEAPTLYEQLEDVIGIAEGLPSDLATNHDHYLHGRPKKS